MKFLILLVIGCAVYLVFRVARLLLSRPGNPRWRNAGIVLVPLEMFVWTAFFFRGLEYLFGTRAYYDYLFTVLLLIAFGFLAWFYLKEVVAGAFFKLQHSPKTGRHLQLDDLDGTIRRISATHISLDTAGGVVVKVPFSKLVGNVFSLSAHKEQTRDFRFTVKVDKRRGKEETADRIRTALLLSPFCSYKDPVEINVEVDDDSSYACEIAVRPLSRRFESRIEKSLTDALRA